MCITCLYIQFILTYQAESTNHPIVPKSARNQHEKYFCSLVFLVTKSSYRDFCSSLTNCKPLVLTGKIRGYASLVPLAEAVPAEEEVACDDFLGRDGALEVSPARLLPMVQSNNRSGPKIRGRG